MISPGEVDSWDVESEPNCEKGDVGAIESGDVFGEALSDILERVDVCLRGVCAV